VQRKAPVDACLADVARAAGVRVGRAAPRDGVVSGAEGTARRVALDVLGDHGYEPVDRTGEIALANCPFHRLAEEHRSLVCGMNLDFLTGVLDGLGADALQARLDPQVGFCCVRIAAA
jgi:predicted ArsR family transcriptional regulator